MVLFTTMPREKLKTATEVQKQLMEAAIYSVKQDGKSENAAAKVFGVNRQTLRNRLQNLHDKPIGFPSKFPPEEEKRLADFLLNCSDMGIPLNRHHCHRLISQLAEQLGTSAVMCTSRWIIFAMLVMTSLSGIIQPLSSKVESDKG